MMQKARLYAFMDGIVPIAELGGNFSGDPEVGSDEYPRLDMELEEYLSQHGTELKEPVTHYVEHEGLYRPNSLITVSAYEIGNATVLVRYAEHNNMDDNVLPTIETLAVRIYSPDNIDKLVKEIKKIVPGICPNRRIVTPDELLVAV